MKGKINKDGFLIIERKGTMAPVMCPFAKIKIKMDDRVSHSPPCGDWCAKFGEPRCSPGKSVVKLKICNGQKLRFLDFEDERQQCYQN